MKELFNEELLQISAKIIDIRRTKEDAGAASDLAQIIYAKNRFNSGEVNERAVINLHEMINAKHPEIKDFYSVVKIKNENAEKMDEQLDRDFYGILAGVLLRNNEIASYEEFMQSKMCG